nr:HAD-IA family hydrolase [Streptomyces sp. SID8379]
MLQDVDGVIFDFDGPVCLLFPDGTASETAAVKAAVWRNPEQIPPALVKVEDTHDLLKEVGGESPEVNAQVADLITAYEDAAVSHVLPTPHIREVVDQLAARGKQLSIASNNAPGPILRFLELHDMSPLFQGRVCGRDPLDLRRLKPAPDSVLRAVAQLGLHVSECALVGDKATDLRAAQAAGTRFIGCTNDAEERDLMIAQGAELVVETLEPLLRAVQSLPART